MHGNREGVAKSFLRLGREGNKEGRAKTFATLRTSTKCREIGEAKKRLSLRSDSELNVVK